MAASTAVLLTPPYGCDGCLQKSQSITELERRISDLYWIRDEEKLLDPVITLGAGPPVNLAELDSTIPAMDAALPDPASVAPASVSQLAPGPGGAPASTGLAASALPSHLQADDHWSLLGAKPKHGTEHIVSSHGMNRGSWHLARRHVRPARNPSVNSSCPTGMTS